MTWTAAAALKVKSEAVAKAAVRGFWFPVPPGLTALPAMPPVVENATPLAPNAVTAPVGFDPDNPDLDDLFSNILVTKVPAIYARVTDVIPGSVIPPYNIRYTYQCRVRVVVEARMQSFEQNATLQAPARIRLMAERTFRIVGMPIGTRRGYQDVATRGLYSITGRAAGIEKRFPLAAEDGAYSITGQPVTLYKGAALLASKGTFTITFPDTSDPSVDYWYALDAQVFGWNRDFYPDWWAD